MAARAGDGPVPSILGRCQLVRSDFQTKGVCATIHVVGGAPTAAERKRILGRGVPRWCLEHLAKPSNKSTMVATENGPAWWVELPKGAKANGQAYSEARDIVGAVWREAFAFNVNTVLVVIENCSSQEELGALVGIELADYSYRPSDRVSLVKKVALAGTSKKTVSMAKSLGQGANWARQLVNSPPKDLNPQSYAKLVSKTFSALPGCNVTTWDAARIKKEKMNLLWSVGAAAEALPAFVKVRYRPKGVDRRPIALVGKGITFDSGGLDLKPADGMRLMKKDMGGSAAVVGALWALASNGAKVPCDVYLPLAENAVSAAAMRPGDVLRSRSGKTVEVHNTDAEGRLVLADALTVAVEQKGANAPQSVIDVATLTGAIKVGLGAEVAGLFANNDELALGLAQAGERAGDPCWRMPLLSSYKKHLQSSFADLANATVTRYGGAISAAVFLQQFVGKVPWAHLDIYAWNDRSSGALRDSGGSGQAVQLLAAHLMPKWFN